MNTPRDVTDEMLRFVAALDQAQAALISTLKEEAWAENEYRKARANAWLAVEGRTMAEREARVDKVTGEERYKAHLSSGLSKAALVNVG